MAAPTIPYIPVMPGGPPPGPARKPLYRQPRAWGEAALIALMCAMAALFVITNASLGTAHSQTSAANASLGRANASITVLHSQYAASQSQNRSLAGQLAAQQGKELVGAWYIGGSNPMTMTFKANHTVTFVAPSFSYSGYWAVGASGLLVIDQQGAGPALPRSQGGGYSDMAYAPTFVISGNTLTLTYGSGSNATTEVYTRS